MTLKRLTLRIPPQDLRRLKSQQLHLKAALSVFAHGQSMSMVIWKSEHLNSGVDMFWIPEYAVNYTITFTPPGKAVVPQVSWMPCELGDTYIVDTNGMFQKQPEKGDAESITIGRVDLKVALPKSVYMLLGVKNAEGKYDAIYIDLISTPGRVYKPEQKVTWWFDDKPAANHVSSQGNRKLAGSADFSSGADSKVSTFSYQTEQWSTADREE